MKANNDEKLSLIRAHPDLVGNATLTKESEGEQQSAGLGSLSSDEVDRFRKFNAEYKERFGFPVRHLRPPEQKGGDPECFPKSFAKFAGARD